MDRRGFMASALPLVVTGFAPALEDPGKGLGDRASLTDTVVPPHGVPLVPIRGASELYRGYALVWTGWKSSMSDGAVLGQWLAWAPDEAARVAYGNKARIYAMVPYGVVAFYRPGETFNTVTAAVDVEARTIELYTSPEVRKAAILAGYQALKQFIDAHGYRAT